MQSVEDSLISQPANVESTLRETPMINESVVNLIFLLASMILSVLSTNPANDKRTD